MPRKIKITNATYDKFGIRIVHVNGTSGWAIGDDRDYLLFDTEEDAIKAMKKMKRDGRYSWNCTVSVAKFTS